MSKEIIDELKLIHTYFDVSKLDVYEHKHHIRLTSIIKDRIDFYVNKSKINETKRMSELKGEWLVKLSVDLGSDKDNLLEVLYTVVDIVADGDKDTKYKIMFFEKKSDDEL